MTRTPETRKSSQRLSVFDFTDDDELVEKASEKLAGKYGNPSRDRKSNSSSPPPIDKLNSFKYFSGPIGAPRKEADTKYIDVDDGPIDINHGDSESCIIIVEKQSCNKINKIIDIDDGPTGDYVGNIATCARAVERDIINNLVDVDFGLTDVGPVEIAEDIECQVKDCSNMPIHVDNGVVQIDTKEDNIVPDEISKLIDIGESVTSHTCKSCVCLPMCKPQDKGGFSVEISCLNTHVTSSLSNHTNEPAGAIFDDKCWVPASLSSISISTPEEREAPKEEEVTEQVSIGHAIDSSTSGVVVYTNFISYKGKYYYESRLTFSVNCIRIDCLSKSCSTGAFNAEWSINDIISIESEWLGKVETALINVYVKENASTRARNEKETSGFEKLQFSVYDPNWSEGQEAIKSLDVRYGAIWNATLGFEREEDDNTIFGGDGTIKKNYCFLQDGPFPDIVYPKGDPDAVSIGKKDMELLQPETFINDTIIDFYIKYLNSKIPQEMQHRYHFFNSFFFRKLADLDKDRSSTSDGRAAFERVKKWTRKVNLFEKDFIFVPVNYSLHWSLIVICHLGEVAYFRDDGSENLHKVPCIVHMDSLQGIHRGLKNLFQSYLYEEWKERNQETADDVSSKFLNLRFVPLELPQQENSFDCGLFLLHYVELFVEEAPKTFSPFNITKRSNFLNRNWFPVEEVSLKRMHILKLIYQIVGNQSEVPAADLILKSSSCLFPEDRCELDNGLEFVERFSFPKATQSTSLDPNVEFGVGFSVSAASPPRSVNQQTMKLGNMPIRLYEPGSSSNSFSFKDIKKYGSCHQKIVLSPVLEVDTMDEHVSVSTSEREPAVHIAGALAQSPTSSCSSVEFLHLEPSLDDTSSFRISNLGYKRSSKVLGDNDFTYSEYEESDDSKETAQVDSSTSSEDLETCVVEDSEEETGSPKGRMDKVSPSFVQENNVFPAPSVEGIDSGGYTDKIGNLTLSSDDSLSDSSIRSAKRQRIVP